MNKSDKNFFELIDKIEEIRSTNNKSWMDILRVAYKNSPKETSEIMKEIYSNDNKISELVSKLID